MPRVTLVVSRTTVTPGPSGAQVTLTATADSPNPEAAHRVFEWSVDEGTVTPRQVQLRGADVEAATTWTLPPMAQEREVTVRVTLREYTRDLNEDPSSIAEAKQRVLALAGGVPDVRQAVREAINEIKPLALNDGSDNFVRVGLQRTQHPYTTDAILWMVIRKTSNNLSFTNYSNFVDTRLFESPGSNSTPTPPSTHRPRLSGVDIFRKLRALTESFLVVNTGVLVKFEEMLKTLDPVEEGGRLGRPLPNKEFPTLWSDYLVNVNGSTEEALPYLALIRNKFPELPFIVPANLTDDDVSNCYDALQKKLSQPLLLELIWNYWHEEGMLVQSVNAISQRFQNVRGPGLRDPLANMEIDPLRPLNSVLWGYFQDEQRRLSVVRRAYEYDHEYGITLHGKAVAGIRTADRRSKFLEAFHNLLHLCVQFFRKDDDTTVVSDGFPVLNALKETHYLLAQGAHNQFGDLPSTARQEMLIQQWLLARPEMREFLGGRVMVPYPEPWMDRVDAMKTLQGWTDISSVHFHELGVFGEQVLLSVRYGGWSISTDPAQAANWARYWRPEIQGYIHAYRAVTGVDLTVELTDPQRLSERDVPPSVHLRNRLASQRRR
ncbi:hypothetical protein MYSTI_01851 [Myxococcus stipitatus DSM 14675]|uniref:Uncharacterized protein n=1 Tax=Myxococcus stipitatus (strain DSM 14675 / JCM 12634 / Mx s8) TaxID=1278073 RepID=L7U4V6_MYXSD|nr:hypothetical protein [Myxococcus stipitatus]AGC43183.1 hypothetical protein MYSTI_01851 [Myxococcus stipitatus DSM 14675]